MKSIKRTVALTFAALAAAALLAGLVHAVLANAGIRNVSAVVAPSLSNRPELFEGAWYTDSNLRDIAFKRRFEEKYPDTRFATHMMPHAYDSVNMIVRAFESGHNPAVYLRRLRSYDGTAGVLTKAPGSGNFVSTPAVWTIENGTPILVRHSNCPWSFRIGGQS